MHKEFGGIRVNFQSVGWAILAGIVAQIACAEDITLKEGDLVLAAPSSVDCDAPPDFILSGPALNSLAGNRADLDKLTSAMAGGLTQACAALDALTVTGEDRGVSFTFEISKSGGWKLGTGSAPAEVAAAPAPEPEPTPAPAPDPEPEPEPVATKPAIEPGLSLEQFTAIFGPVQMLQGHAFLDQRNETWKRLLAARTYAENPDILSNDLDALEVAKMLMTPTEYQQFMGANAGKQVNQISVFDRRDLANRVRTQLRPGLDQRRQTGPIKVYNTTQIRLGEYDFNTSSFPLDARNLRNHQRPSWRTATIYGAFDKFALPTRLNATVDQARQLDEYLRSRNDVNLWMAIFAEIEPPMPRMITNAYAQNRQRPDGTLTRIAIFADQGLTQLLYDFTADLAEEQAAIDAAFRVLNTPIAGGEDLVRAVATISGSEAPVTTLIETYANAPDYNNPPQSPDERRAAAQSALAASDGGKSVVFGGQVRLGAYDPVRKVFPIQQLRPQHMNLVGLPNMGFSARVNFVPTPTEIPVEPEAAQAIMALGQGNYLEIRMEAEMIQGSVQPQNAEYVELQASFRPAKITLFSGQPGALPADRRLIADVELTAAAPQAPSLIEGLLTQQ